MIETSKGKILLGGKVDKKDRYVEPTIIDNPDPKSLVLEEEIFGPILPIITFK
jgi:acyl-CoA reductase-like NAD-dependent aldehyde dehydrogenase